MIPELSENQSKRTSMNSLRNAFGVIANLSIYIGLYSLLRNDVKSNDVNPSDLDYFRVSVLSGFNRFLVLCVLLF